MEDVCRSSLFYTDQGLCYAEILSPSEVQARIQVAVLNFIKILNSPDPAISDLSLEVMLKFTLHVYAYLTRSKNGALFLTDYMMRRLYFLISRRSSNSRFRRGLLSDISSIFLSHSFCTRSLMKTKDAKAFVRVWEVMEQCFQLLVQEKQATQRELFYKLLCLSPDYFNSQAQVNRTVQDVVALLRCCRHSLGIIASSRGTMIGRLLMQEPNQEMVDCSVLGPSGYAISGDLSLLKELVLQSDARYIILVEKDAVFQRLAEDRIYNQIPCILLTAKGYPDMATRFLLHQMSRCFPDLPILALVDWNPAGLAILCTYKYGSTGMGLEAYKYACNVRWLGLHGDDLELVHENSFIPLKHRDLQIAKSLQSSEVLQEVYKAQLTKMVESGHRAEIEALYCHGFDFLAKYVIRKIVQSDYI